MNRRLMLAAVALLVPACGGGGREDRPGNGGGTDLDQPPLVSIRQPPSNTRFFQGEDIEVQADVIDPDGFVVQVDFFSGSAVLATATVFPFEFVWSGAAPGTYSLTAVATDNEGVSAASDPIRIDVFPTGSTPIRPNLPPVVSFSNPPDGTFFREGTPIQLVADAGDGDGSIIQVDFFEGSTLLGSLRSPPFQLTWSGAAPGAYSLRAVATDSGRASVASTPVAVTIVPDE